MEIHRVPEPIVTHRAHRVLLGVHAITGAERVGRRRSRRALPVEQGAAVHVVGHAQPGCLQHRRCEIEQLDHLGTRDTCLQSPRPARDERDPQPRLVRPPLRPRKARPVVAPEHDEGVVGEAVLLELIQDAADPGIHRGDEVDVTRPGPTESGGVGVVRRERDGLRIAALVVPQRGRRGGIGIVPVDTRFMRDEAVEGGEEGGPGGRPRQCAEGEQSSKAVGGVSTWKSVNQLLVV